MIPNSNARLAELAKELVAAAGQQNILLRVLGGIGVYLTCPSLETHPTLLRTVKDIDLAAPRSQLDAITALMLSSGMRGKSRTGSELVFVKGEDEIEVIPPDFQEDHRIDLSARLALSSPTLPVADLLLIKLQRVRFAEKDIQDSIALLLDHRVAEREAESQIDPEYIARLTARDWGLFRTVYDNTITLEKVLDKYVDREEAQLVWRRIELIQGEMDQQPKSLVWMLNQVVRRPAEVPA